MVQGGEDVAGSGSERVRDRRGEQGQEKLAEPWWNSNLANNNPT